MYITYDLVLKNGQAYPCISTYMTQEKEDGKYYVLTPSEITNDMNKQAAEKYALFYEIRWCIRNTRLLMINSLRKIRDMKKNRFKIKLAEAWKDGSSMKRIVMMVLRNLFFVPWIGYLLNWYAGHVDDYPEEKRYALLKKIDRRANTGGNITIKSYGTENIPSENGFMFIRIIRDCMMCWR